MTEYARPVPFRQAAWDERPAITDDTGSSMIFILILVTVIAVVLGALLSLVDTSLRTTVGERALAAATYSADGAAQAAVHDIRTHAFNGATGQHCFSNGTDNLPLTGFTSTQSATVTCAADPAKVLIQCPSLSQCNRPGSAILTLGNVAGEPGLNVQQPNGSEFKVHGVVFSNSTINVANGSLTTNAAAYARGACTGTVTSTPPVACNYGTTANVIGDDPNYPPATTTLPAYRSMPACTTPNSVVTFEPGYYDDAAKLTAMMAGNSACKHSTWWFKPGVYYFDFHNGGTDPNPLLGGGNDVWTVDDGYLVAGTPKNGLPAAIPGACVNPIKDATANGVQFIFGGDSQLNVKSGQVEICGTYSASRPPVAVYGLTTGSATTTALTGLTLTTVTAAGSFGASATAANLANVDTASASWKSTKKNDSATVTVDGFAPPSAIPAGSVLKSATLKVTHRHSDTGSSDNLSVTLTPSGGPAVTGSVAGHGGGPTYLTDSVPLDAAATGGLAKAIYDGTFTGARVATTVNLSANNDTEDVNAIQLDLTYVAPAWRAGNGCVTATPYTGSPGASCALITTVNNAGNLFYVQGTTYAPGAAVDITLNNAAEQVFRFGVVARSLWAKLTGSFSYTGVVIEVPDDSPGFVFSVYLAVYTCPYVPAATCPVTGTPRLRAKVAFVDADPATPVAGRRQVVVLSWSTPT
jgi:hypothetical protein